MTKTARSTTDLPVVQEPSAKRARSDTALLSLINDKTRLEKAVTDGELGDVYRVLVSVGNPLLIRYWNNSSELQEKVWTAAQASSVWSERFESLVHPLIRENRGHLIVAKEPSFVADVDELQDALKMIIDEIKDNEFMLVTLRFNNPVFVEYLKASPKLQADIWEACRKLGAANGREMREILKKNMPRDGNVRKDDDEEEEEDDDEEEEDDDEGQAMDHESSGSCVRTKAEWARVVELAKRGKFDEIDPEIQVRFFHNILAIYKHAKGKA